MYSKQKKQLFLWVHGFHSEESYPKVTFATPPGDCTGPACCWSWRIDGHIRIFRIQIDNKINKSFQVFKSVQLRFVVVRISPSSVSFKCCWTTYGCPMVFLLKPPFSHGFPMVFTNHWSCAPNLGVPPSHQLGWSWWPRWRCFFCFLEHVWLVVYLRPWKI